VWAGHVAFGVIVAVLVGYLVVVGLDRADKVASSIGVIVALIALGMPYLLPSTGGGTSMPDPDRVEDSGNANARGGGQANTGVQGGGDDRPARVTRSGDATAGGPGSVANTGVQRERRP
jgi:hypothetical protein